VSESLLLECDITNHRSQSKTREQLFDCSFKTLGDKMRYINLIIIILIILLTSGCGGASSSLKPSKTIAHAEQGNANAQNDLGSMYQYGDGVAKDYKKAVMWYEKSASQGLAMAKVNLGYMYDSGLGVQQDKKKAIALYREAANLSEPRGMINLAEMYRTGDSIEQSNLKAFMWLDIARFYTQNTKDMQAKWAARSALDKVKKGMSAEQINEGKKLSKDWIKKNRM
jgi:TPR repeat protein